MGRSGFDAVTPVRRNEQMVTGLQFDPFYVRFLPDRKNRRPRNQQHPLMLILIVPEPFRRGMAVGNNPLNANMSPLCEHIDQLFRQLIRNPTEKIFFHGFSRQGLFLSEQDPQHQIGLHMGGDTDARRHQPATRSRTG